MDKSETHDYVEPGSPESVAVIDRLFESDAIVTFFSDPNVVGGMIARFIQTPLADDDRSLTAHVTPERVQDKEYPWIESILSEVYHKAFGGLELGAADITTLYATGDQITAGITLGNDRGTVVMEAENYIHDDWGASGLRAKA